MEPQAITYKQGRQALLAVFVYMGIATGASSFGL